MVVRRTSVRFYDSKLKFTESNNLHKSLIQFNEVWSNFSRCYLSPIDIWIHVLMTKITHSKHA